MGWLRNMRRRLREFFEDESELNIDDVLEMVQEKAAPHYVGASEVQLPQRSQRAPDNVLDAAAYAEARVLMMPPRAGKTEALHQELLRRHVGMERDLQAHAAQMQMSDNELRKRYQDLLDKVAGNRISAGPGSSAASPPSMVHRGSAPTVVASVLSTSSVERNMRDRFDTGRDVLTVRLYNGVEILLKLEQDTGHDAIPSLEITARLPETGDTVVLTDELGVTPLALRRVHASRHRLQEMWPDSPVLDDNELELAREGDDL